MRVANIFVPVDLGPLSDAALAHAVALAQPFAASIALLHVMKPQLPQLAMEPGALGAAVVVQPPAQPSEDAELPVLLISKRSHGQRTPVE